ncbi:hypothetical protein EBU99_04875 [bacterium]|nr:hypothetical protein [bacterium]
MSFCRKSALWGALGGLCSSVLVWGSYRFFAVNESQSRADVLADQFIISAQQTLFSMRGQAVSPAQLSTELKASFDRAHALRLQTRRDADLQFYKELDKIARFHLLEKTLASRAASEQKSLTDVEAQLLPRDEATTDDARLLYEASDPSAPREGFAAVRPQLISYLNEVRRREALEKWSNELRNKGEWSLAVERPGAIPNVADLNLEGLPREGKSQANAIVFVDYLCEGCVPFLVDFAKHLEENRGVLKPVYVPFPYTRPEISMALARGSLCAHQLGDFSSFHLAALTKSDLLSEVPVFELAKQGDFKTSDFRSCYRSGEGLAELLGRAQKLARSVGLMQTPAVVFQGQLFEGPGLLESLEKAMRAAAKQGQLTKRGDENKRR